MYFNLNKKILYNYSSKAEMYIQYVYTFREVGTRVLFLADGGYSQNSRLANRANLHHRACVGEGEAKREVTS